MPEEKGVMWLLLPFVILPIVEIALFIQVGGVIGVLPTIALVLASAVAGAAVMRHQVRARRWTCSAPCRNSAIRAGRWRMARWS